VLGAAVLGALLFLRVLAKARQDRIDHYNAILEAKRMRLAYDGNVRERERRSGVNRADYELVN